MLEKVKEVLVQTTNIDPNEVTMEASLKDDLGVDSLDSVEIILELESQFNVKISDDELAELKTIGDIVNILNNKLK
ncbi:MAG: acyl carrier protein [Erysipelotrichaceae bacterium]|nr:acyl carrier protein [Erysipelotrichaceae bacterium]